MIGRERLLLLVAVAVSLLVGEFLVRLFLPPPGFFPFPQPDYGVLVRDSVRGYTYAPNIHRDIITQDSRYAFQTNELGMRDSAVERVLPRGPRILAIGDSYTQGLGVAAPDAWPKQLQALVPGSRVYNAGVSGYSLRQIRLAAEHFTPRVRPHLIVLGLYGHGYYRMTSPHVLLPGAASVIQEDQVGNVLILKDGFLYPLFDHARARRIGFWIDRYWQLAGHTLHAIDKLASERRNRGTNERVSLDSAMAPMTQELSRLIRFADSSHVPMVVLFVNFQEADGSYHRDQFAYNAILRRVTDEHHLCVIDPLPVFLAAAKGQPTFRFPHNQHWSPAAHALAARLVWQSVSSPAQDCRASAAALTKPKD